MIDGKITRYDCSWFYLGKSHFCPGCKTVLERKKREVIVNSESEEAKNYRYNDKNWFDAVAFIELKSPTSQ